MEFEFDMWAIVKGSFSVAIELLRFHEGIFKPAQPVERSKIARNSRRIKLFSGMNGELPSCRLRSNVLKPCECDFVDDSARRHGNRSRALDGLILRMRKRRDYDEKPKKRHHYGSTDAHAFPAPGNI
jgi:hypothetical protein